MVTILTLISYRQERNSFSRRNYILAFHIAAYYLYYWADFYHYFHFYIFLHIVSFVVYFDDTLFSRLSIHYQAIGILFSPLLPQLHFSYAHASPAPHYHHAFIDYHFVNSFSLFSSFIYADISPCLLSHGKMPWSAFMTRHFWWCIIIYILFSKDTFLS